MALTRRFDMFSDGVSSFKDELEKLRNRVELQDINQSSSKQNSFNFYPINCFFQFQTKPHGEPLEKQLAKIEDIGERLSIAIFSMDPIMCLIVEKLNEKPFTINDSFDNAEANENVLKDNIHQKNNLTSYSENSRKLLMKIETVQQSNKTVIENLEKKFKLILEAKNSIKELKNVSCGEKLYFPGYYVYLEIFYKVAKFFLFCNQRRGSLLKQRVKNDQLPSANLINFLDEIVLGLNDINEIYKDAFTRYEVA